MGRLNRRKIWLAGAALALGLGSIGVYLLNQCRAGGPDASPPRPFLTVHGPNDGEPLNNSIDFKLDSSAGDVCYVIVYHGSRFVTVAPVFPGEGSTRLQIDSTRFLNGKVNLTFFLWDEYLNRLHGTASWVGRVENPSLAGDVPSGRLAPLQLQGRSGDLGYVLVAGQDPAELNVVPAGKTRSPHVRLIATGLYSGHLADWTPCSDHVLNLDDLVRVHTRNGLVILWSVDSRSRWSHSKLVTVQNILDGGLPSIHPAYGDGYQWAQSPR